MQGRAGVDWSDLEVCVGDRKVLLETICHESQPNCGPATPAWLKYILGLGRNDFRYATESAHHLGSL